MPLRAPAGHVLATHGSTLGGHQRAEPCQVPTTVSCDGGDSLAFDADRCGDGVDVVGAVVALPVDEEGGGAGDAAEVGGFDILRDAGRVRTSVEVVDEAGGVEIQLLGIV